MSEEPIRVLLADDHPALRMGLRVLLEQSPEISVMAEAGSGPEALRQITALQPDVAILDCQLPGMTGAAVAAEARQRGARTRILALSAYQDEQYVQGMLSAGAVGYLLKEEAPGVIVSAVQAAARGQGWFSPAIAAQVAAWVRGERSSGAHLTEREWEVLHLVVRGRSNKEIAHALCITERTVEFHIGNILSRLGVGSRVEAAVWGRDHGLTP